MTYLVRFASLSGPMSFVRTEEFPSRATALAAVTAHATSGGLSDVKDLDEEDGYSVRFTARTAGGRAGRNVAFADIA